MVASAPMEAGAQPATIPLGICIAPERVPELAPGYDFVELSLSNTLMPLEQNSVYAPRVAELKALHPPVRAFNLFVPAQVRLTGDGVDWGLVRLYVARALQRTAELGGEVVVFGSGGARNVPEGYPRALAWGQLVQFLSICADEAGPLGVTIAIEPLNKGESNILNTYLEGVELASDVKRDEVRVLADLYHFMVDDEPLDDILQAPEWLAHVHVADSGRRHPGSGDYPLPRLFSILKEIGYGGRVSIECSWGDDFGSESAHALEYLRTLA